MTDELSRKSWAIVVNGGLVAWEDDIEVEAMKQAIANKVEMIELSDGSFVQTRSINILSPLAYDTWSRQQRGMWKCKYDNWHNRNEHCECGRQ
jgi:hypothetical protein